MTDPSPVEWAVRPLRHYANFNGRAPRAEYWWFYLLTVVLDIPPRLLDNAFGTPGVLSSILSIALLVPWLAVTVRRLHDTNRTGWWLFIFIVGFAFFGLVVVFASSSAIGSGAFGSAGWIIVGLIMIALVSAYLFFMVMPGTEGSNDYGADPYGPDDLEEVFA